MTMVTVGDVDLFYEIDGGGPPCLVLHGGLGVDHQLYRGTLQPLADDFQMVFYDHRGNGRSSRPATDSMSMEQWADDAVGLADALGFDRFVAFGHSYGGFIAQELAVRHPERLSGLVLVDTTPGQLGTGERPDDQEQGPPPPQEFLDLLVTEVATDEAFAAQLARMMPFYFAGPVPPDIEALFAATVVSAATAGRSMEVLAAWSSVDRLSSIAVPTLALAGRHDVMTSWPQARRIATRIPGAEMTVFEQSGHFPWIEEPEVFFSRVRAWCEARLT